MAPGAVPIRLSFPVCPLVCYLSADSCVDRSRTVRGKTELAINRIPANMFQRNSGATGTITVGSNLPYQNWIGVTRDYCIEL